MSRVVDVNMQQEVRRRFRTKYDRLPSEDYDEVGSAKSDFIPEQFRAPETRIPWKSIIFGLFLFVVGATLLSMAVMISVGKMDQEIYADRKVPFLLFGFLTIIPGSYVMFLTVMACCRVRGFCFDDIPQDL